MKQRIASFLGELAEEMGWEPDLEELRVRDKVQPTVTSTSPSEPTEPPRPQRDADIRQLRKTLMHLAAEVSALRAQVARLRNLPVPPDAPPQEPSPAYASPTRAPRAAQTSSAWPPHVVPLARPSDDLPDTGQAFAPPPVPEPTPPTLIDLDDEGGALDDFPAEPR